MKFRSSSIGNTKIKFATTMKCDSGHEFGLDIDKLGSFYGRLPSTVRCPYPTCTARVPVKVKEPKT